MNQDVILENVINIINDVKSTGFSAKHADMDFYLGGDLGIDSVEMLEIWYEIENALKIKVEDGEKRNLYTLEDIVNIIDLKINGGSLDTEDLFEDEFDYDSLVMPS